MNVHPDHDLLQEYLDGVLDAAGVLAVENRLKADPQLADALILLTREESIYREWAGITQAADEQIVEQQVASAIEPSMRPQRPRRVRVLAAGVLVAGTLAIMIALAMFVSQPAPSPAGPAVATLEDVQGEVKILGPNGHVELAQSGQAIPSGHEIQTGEDESSTVVRLQDCRLVLASETRIRLGEETLSDAPLVYVSEGIVAADMSGQTNRQRPVLRSPLAEVRGAYGKFSFVSMPDATFLETDSGSARLTRKSDGRSVEVPRGQFAVVKSTREPLQPRALTARMTSAIRTIPQVGNGPVSGLYFEPEGTTLITASGDSLKRWEVATGRMVMSLFGQKKKTIRHFSPAIDGRMLAFSSEDRGIRVIDTAGALDRWAHKSFKKINTSATSPDSRTVAVSFSAAKDGHEVKLFDVALGLEQMLVTGHAGPVVSLAFSPRGEYLATAGNDRSIRIWGARDLRPVAALTRLQFDPRTIVFSPDEHVLAVGDRKGTIHMIDPLTGSIRRVLTGHLREVVGLAFAPDGQYLASCSTDGTARYWDLNTGSEVTSFKGHANAIHSVAFSQDGRILATGGADRKVLLWNLAAARTE